MRKNYRLITALMAMAFVPFVLVNQAVAGKDAGEGHDYRTFHTDGKIELGRKGGRCIDLLF